MEETPNRVHLKATQGTKGTWQLEISVEGKDNATVKQMLDQGITDAFEVLKAHELPIAGDVIEKK